MQLDLKPSNIMLTRVNHDVRLIDLGCCYMDSRPDLTGLTEAYAAPEQLDGSRDVDARTDIYALGRILHDIHASGLEPIACRCLQERKEDRFQSVSEILELLDNNQRPRKKMGAPEKRSPQRRLRFILLFKKKVSPRRNTLFRLGETKCFH